MGIDKPMKLLLIEDDVDECAKFGNCVSTRTDITFIGMTGSSFKGIEYVNIHYPEGIILDLELNNGNGSGICFLAELKRTALPFRPLVVVTTNSHSGLVHNHISKDGADFVFNKWKPDYSHDMVLNHLVAFRNSMRDAGDLSVISVESPEERRKRIGRRIEAELNAIGILTRYKGYQHLYDGIEMLVNGAKEENVSVINRIAVTAGCTYGGVMKAMASAINKAWAMCAPQDLKKHYTAYISTETGVPTPSQFIHFYANKISKSM